MNATQTPANTFRTTSPKSNAVMSNSFKLSKWDRLVDTYLLDYHPAITEGEKVEYRREFMKMLAVYAASAVAFVGIIWFLAQMQ